MSFVHSMGAMFCEFVLSLGENAAFVAKESLAKDL